MIAMHFAPDMIPSGMARSGADMIWLRMVLEVCTRSRAAPRRSDAAAQRTIEIRTSTANAILLIAQLRSHRAFGLRWQTGVILRRLRTSLAARNERARLLFSDLIGARESLQDGQPGYIA